MQWGKDFVQGMIDGVTKKAQDLWDKAKELAGGIADFLHFSRPETGPLRDYESWMPDMVKGMADGIRKNKGLLTSAISDLSEELKARFDGTYTVNGGNQTVMVPVYLNGRQIALATDSEVTGQASSREISSGRRVAW